MKLGDDRNKKEEPLNEFAIAATTDERIGNDGQSNMPNRIGIPLCDRITKHLDGNVHNAT